MGLIAAMEVFFLFDHTHTHMYLACRGFKVDSLGRQKGNKNMTLKQLNEQYSYQLLRDI